MERYIYSVEIIGGETQTVDFAGLMALLPTLPQGYFNRVALEGVHGGYELAIYERIENRQTNNVKYPRTLLGMARVIDEVVGK